MIYKITFTFTAILPSLPPLCTEDWTRLGAELVGAAQSSRKHNWAGAGLGELGAAPATGIS